MTINIPKLDIESYRDTLGEKTTITEEDISSLKEVSSFTNYVVAPGDKDHPVSLNWKDLAKNVFMSNVSINNYKESVYLGDIDIGNLNLNVNGQLIYLAGAIKAGSVNIAAYMDDKNVKSPGGPFSGGSFFNVSTRPLIDIAENASIETTTDGITLRAESHQSYGMLDLFVDVIADKTNVVSVKLTTAEINVRGKLSSAGNIDATTIARASLKVSNDEFPGDVLWPLATTVMLTKACVDVYENANVNAKGSISYNTESYSTAKAIAVSDSQPAAISVVVNLNDSHVLLRDQSYTEAGGNVTLSAKANTVSYSEAKKHNYNEDWDRT